MPLNEILNPDIIDLEVQGETKDEVLRYMAGVLLKNGYINDVDTFVKDIYEREAEGPTGMGSGISIPHGKSNSVLRNGIMIGKTVNPIRWESSFQTTDILMVKKAVMDGMGVAPDLPLLHCAKEIASGDLVVILDGWHRAPIPAYTVCSNAAWHSRRNRIFMNWWSERFLREFGETERLARATLGERALMYLQEGK